MQETNEAIFSLNQENFELLESLLSGLDSEVIGGMHQIKMSEQELTRVMKEMDDDCYYSNLKDYLQQVGNEQLGW